MTDDMDAALRAHAPLVRRAAGRLMARMPASVEMDDMIQAGMIGLWQALLSHDAARGASVTTWAEHRVAGAMLDELRTLDPVGRADRAAERRAADAWRALASELGREPRAAEVAARCGMTLDDYHALIGRLHAAAYCDDEAWDVADDATTPLERLEMLDRVRTAMRAVERMPERQRQVVELMLEGNITMAAAGAMMGVSGSRVCQLIDKAVDRLREI